MRLDLAKLRAFVEVARAGSHAVAARRLHVTPSAVSHALRSLQESGGVPDAEDAGNVLAKPDVGRNDPCPCGSGKKYKKCCGA